MTAFVEALEETSQTRFLNRELSSVDWYARVLTMAKEDSTPLLERLNFMAIFANFVDEFYMVRVAGLKRQAAAGLQTRSPDGLTPKEQLAEIAEKVAPLVQEHARLFVDELLPALTKESIDVLRWSDVDESAKDLLGEVFVTQIFPVLTPLAVDPGHPFPYISNRSLNLAVLVRDPKTQRTRFARVKVPPLLARFVALPDGVFVPLEDVIAAHLDRLFPGMEVVEHHAFRVTRNADLEVNDDGAEDLLEALEEELQKRRFSPAVRLEIAPGMPEHVLVLLMSELQVEESDVHSLPGLLDLTGLWQLYELDRPDLKHEPFTPVTHPELALTEDQEPDIFQVVRDHDILVHHPYESFTTSVERFIEEAASDPDVLAIKQTLYRTSGESPIVEALIDAAESGKQVVVLVEIKARFDERNNINWARTLERAGCHVVYGLMGLKTHCKLCLVVRQEGRELRRYAHVGTGNYNPKTARLYEDLGILTANQTVGADVSELFNYLTGYSRQTRYRSLLVAPNNMRSRVIKLIEQEAGKSTAEDPGRIAMKLNSLVDADVIDALYRASRAGVHVDLIVRSICSLRPGVPGLSENIKVHSIVGRFLEHSRILYFRNGGDEAFFIGSADMMPRNLDGRVETLVTVLNPGIREELRVILDTGVRANVHAWNLEQDGRWTRRPAGDDDLAIDLQAEMVARASGGA